MEFGKKFPFFHFSSLKFPLKNLLKINQGGKYRLIKGLVVFRPHVIGGSVPAHLIQPPCVHQVFDEEADIALKAQGAGRSVGEQLVAQAGRLVDLAGRHGPVHQA